MVQNVQWYEMGMRKRFSRKWKNVTVAEELWSWRKDEISKSHSVVCNSDNFPGHNIGVGSLSLLQGISQPRDWTQVSHIAGGFFTSWATRNQGCRQKVQAAWPHLHRKFRFYSNFNWNNCHMTAFKWRENNWEELWKYQFCCYCYVVIGWSWCVKILILLSTISFTKPHLHS